MKKNNEKYKYIYRLSNGSESVELRKPIRIKKSYFEMIEKVDTRFMEHFSEWALNMVLSHPRKYLRGAKIEKVK